MRKRNEQRRVTFDPLDIEEDAEEQSYSFKGKSLSTSIHSISPLFAATFIVAFFCLYGVVVLLDGVLPSPLKIADEEQFPNSFVTERARNYLKSLTDLGPRVVGSYENEMLAVQILKREIETIIHNKHPSKNIEFDLQTVTGSYYLDFKPHGSVNAYGNVQNLIVKLSSNNSSQHSILVNAHFDSVPTSPGGSDDGINCAVLLELLRILSKSTENFTHDIIFLFNGAEESFLQAAHGFITQHKWAKQSKVVVNLEAAGAGGKIYLFQTGPGHPWLVTYYSKVPHPTGQVTGEEIFQSNLVPSDTDFRVFRDFGNVIGYDMAFVRNGYRYHTKYDGFNNIPLGSFQHVGDNVLYLIRMLANAPEINNLESQDQMKVVYYDFFGLFMIVYKTSTAAVLNYLTVALCWIVALKSFYTIGLGINMESIKFIVINGGGILSGWLISLIFIVSIGFFIDYMGYSMSWYRNPWIILGLYVLPVLSLSTGIVLLANRFTTKKSVSLAVQTQVQLNCVRLIWSVPLLLGTVLNIRSAHVIQLPLFFNILVFILIHFTKLQYTVRTWQLLHVLSTFIPVLYLMWQIVTLFSLFIPICGRFGSNKNPELFIGIMALVITVFISSFYVPLITLVQKAQYISYVLFAIFLIFFTIVFTPLGFPYSGDEISATPQRFWIQHTGRVFYDIEGKIRKQDAGFFFLNLDRNSPHSVAKYVKDIDKIQNVDEFCKSELYCGLPVMHPRALQILDASSWIPAEQPLLQERTNLILQSRENLSSTLIQFNFSTSGPSHMSIYFALQKGVSFKQIDLSNDIKEGPVWNGLATYFINYSWGKEKTPLNFSLSVEVPENWDKPTLDVAVLGRYVHDRQNVKTPHFQQFLREFPDWADVTAWLGSLKIWKF